METSGSQVLEMEYTSIKKSGRCTMNNKLKMSLLSAQTLMLMGCPIYVYEYKISPKIAPYIIKQFKY